MVETLYNNTKIEITKWKQHEAIQFIAGGYEALLIPEVGANLVNLKDTIRGLNLIRTPGEEMTFEEFKERPQLYGIPILFPPNRIEDGRFIVNQKQYQFPLNEPKNHNHIHGFLRNEKWIIDELHNENNESVSIRLKFFNNRNSEFYKFFPHTFSVFLTYKLSSKGLHQKLEVLNEDKECIPLGVGFHTAFNVPFHPASNKEDYVLKASVSERWQLNQRSLPTGKLLSLNGEEKEIREKGINPLKGALDHLYTICPLNEKNNSFRGAILEDRKKKIRLMYEMGEKYSHMMVWNCLGEKNFVCTEPQSWVINAPNMNLSADLTGFTLLKPGEVWSEFCHIYTENLE